MNTLFAIKALNNPGGGAERVLADVASGLAARGHRVGILSFDAPGGRSFYNLDGRITRLEVPVGSPDRPSTLWETLRRVAALRSRVLSARPDIVIGFMHSMYIPMGVALVGTGIPLLASEHIVPEHFTSKPLERIALRFTPWLADKIAVVSEQAKAAYMLGLRRAMVVISNPVSVAAYGRADVLGGKKARKVLLTVGRLTNQKDHATLIDAMALIAGQVPDWELRIVGDGELRPRLEAQIAALGLDGRVRLPGSTRDIASEYLAAQLFVLPSRYESFGLVTVEALTHGLPVVGFADCAGTNQLIQPGVNGVLVSGEDRARALAEALAALMTDGQRRLALAQGAKTVMPVHFSLDAVLDRWETVLREIIDARASRRYTRMARDTGPAREPPSDAVP